MVVVLLVVGALLLELFVVVGVDIGGADEAIGVSGKLSLVFGEFICGVAVSAEISGEL